MRWKITIEYDGSGFSGWQRQENAASVQARLEEALQAFSGVKTVIHGAGRTDSGVHAAGQIAHFDLPADMADKFSAGNIIGAFNHHLEGVTIAVIAAEAVSDDFDARFSATKRIYDYTVILRYTPIVLLRHLAWQVPYDLDLSAMRSAANNFLGKHDFTSFRAAACQADNPVRSLDRLELAQEGEALIITAEARSFLHHQVRNIVGALVAVGRKQISPDDITALLEARNRSLAPPTAPPQGLCLRAVKYE